MTKFVKDGWTGEMPPSFCPFCFHLLNGATNMQGQSQPEPGDFTICIRCAKVLRYGENMQLEASALEEIPMHSRLAFAKIVQYIQGLP